MIRAPICSERVGNVGRLDPEHNLRQLHVCACRRRRPSIRHPAGSTPMCPIWWEEDRSPESNRQEHWSPSENCPDMNDIKDLPGSAPGGYGFCWPHERHTKRGVDLKISSSLSISDMGITPDMPFRWAVSACFESFFSPRLALIREADGPIP